MTKITWPAQDAPLPIGGTPMDPIWYEKFLELSKRIDLYDAKIALYDANFAVLQSFITNGGYRELTYTPVLSASAGTIPTFTGVALTGRAFRIGRLCFVRVVATNTAGGTPGAGAQQLSVSLPAAVAATAIAGRINASMFYNSTTEGIAFIEAGAGATTGLLYKLGSSANQVALTNADFNNVTRGVSFSFYYPTD